MGWKSADEIVDSGEVAIRLKQSNDLPVVFLGRSVHQIATVTNEGDVYCLGKKLERKWIEGWIELPPPNWAKQ